MEASTTPESSRLPASAAIQVGAVSGARERSIGTAALLGQVMLLVAVAIGFLSLGSVFGRDLSPGAALACSLGAFGMLLIQAFGGERFRVGGFALGWLFAVGFAIGLGMGPVLAHYAASDPGVITQAAGVTALIVAAMGFGGLAISHDLAGWLRPLTFAVFALVVVSLVLVLFGSGGSPLLSLAIGAISAVLILVDVNFLRRHGTEQDVVIIATGIFVSIVNIFLSLLNLFSNE